MDNVEIRCSRCKATIQHVCDESLISAITHLQTLIVEAPEELFHIDNDYYQPGDENAPFLSEGFLYPLLGKEGARTVLAAINNVIRAAGIDPRHVV